MKATEMDRSGRYKLPGNGFVFVIEGEDVCDGIFREPISMGEWVKQNRKSKEWVMERRIFDDILFQ